MNYDLFISDFDGTLVRADGTVTESNKQAIASYREKGGIFAICTGRMMTSIRPRLKELGLTEGLVAAFHGAQIADVASGNLLRSVCFEERDALEILRFMEAHKLLFQLYAGDEFYASEESELLKGYESVCRVKAILPGVPLSEFVLKNRMQVIKIIALSPKTELKKMHALLAEAFGGKYYVATSSDYLVELMPKESSKAAAVRFLSEYYKIPIEKIAAIGDHVADIPMIAACGGRFAVANAVEPLKEIATVVPSVDDDGVAYTLTNYAMGR